ncbi:MAG: SUKH-4 family immunity protein [Planctomycetaceae bacterium]
MEFDTGQHNSSSYELQKWDASTLEQFGLPAETLGTLTTTGLPRKKNLEPLANSPHRLIKTDGYSYLVVAIDSGFLLAVETSMGTVVWIDDESNELRFVNSSCKHFLDCLVLYDRMRQHGREIDASALPTLVRETEAAMEKVDLKIFDGLENYWSVVFERIHDELP